MRENENPIHPVWLVKCDKCISLAKHLRAEYPQKSLIDIHVAQFHAHKEHR